MFLLLTTVILSLAIVYIESASGMWNLQSVGGRSRLVVKWAESLPHPGKGGGHPHPRLVHGNCLKRKFISK